MKIFWSWQSDPPGKTGRFSSVMPCRMPVLVRGRPSCGFFRSVADCRYGYRY